MMTSRTRSLPAENGCTGHHAPIVATKVSNVCCTLARSRVDWRTAGRRNAVTTLRPLGLSVAVIFPPHGAALCGRAAGLERIAAKAAQHQRPERQQPGPAQVERVTAGSGEAA